MKKLKHILRKVEKHSPTILTCIGAGGVVLTAIASAKAAPKANMLIEMATDEKGEELTFLEKVKVAAPMYIPTVLMAGSTITCVFGANVLNKKYQASLTSAYLFLDSSYKEYRAKVIEMNGKEFDLGIRNDIRKKHIDEVANIDILPEDKILFYDEASGRFFHSTMEEVKDAEYEFNRKLALTGTVCLNDFYDLLGLDEVSVGYDYVWSFDCPAVSCYGWIDFYHDLVTAEDKDDTDFQEFYRIVVPLTSMIQA